MPAASPERTAGAELDLGIEDPGTRLGSPALVAVGGERTLWRWRLAGDAAAGLAAGVLGALVADAGGEPLPLAAALALAWLAATAIVGLHAPVRPATWASGAREAPRLALAGLLLSWPAAGLVAAAGATHAARGALAAAALAPLAAGAARATARLVAHRGPVASRRVVILGSGRMAAELVARLRTHPEFGLDPVGFLDDDPGGAAGPDVLRLGALSDLADHLAAGNADRVMIAFSRAGDESLARCLRVCREAGVPVDVVPRLFEHVQGARLDGIGGLPVLALSPPGLSAPARAAKRGLDVAGAALGLALFGPLLLVLAAAIRLDSPGPALFVQRRTGRGGHTFRMYKLRSMRLAADVEVGRDGTLAKGPRDERITRVGRLLRRFSLDEAPQLVNVLRGEMSLVGPRPLVLVEASTLTERWQDRRADLRPGLTGPWQVSGRSHLSFAEMMRLDFQYVTGWSLARDVEILLATLPTVLSGRGAY